MNYPLKFKNSIKNFDYLLLALVLFLVGFGILMVYSASYYSAGINLGDKFFFLRKQVIGAVIGFVGLIAFSFVDYSFLKKLKWIAFAISILLLLIVFLPGVGKTNYGAQRWINLGFFTIQPSEIAKFGFVLFASASLAHNLDRIKTLRGIIPTVFAGGSICLLIILEPNMSITVVVGLSMLVMLFVSGVSFKHFVMLAIPILALIPILIIIEPYRLNRLSAFLNPWASPLGEGYQLIQSLYSLGSGGWFGTGLFSSRQKYLFLPFSESDFIFSIIGEEFGLVGCIFISLVFLVIIIRAFSISMRASSRFGCYLASGIGTIIGLQFLVNIAVVSGCIPPTGLPLPFISAGSSSLIVFMCAVGILLNISSTASKRGKPSI